MKIQIPVECHNGHKANWYFEINGLVVTTIGVPYDEKCDCPKGDFGFGYQAVGPPSAVAN